MSKVADPLREFVKAYGSTTYNETHKMTFGEYEAKLLDFADQIDREHERRMEQNRIRADSELRQAGSEHYEGGRRMKRVVIAALALTLVLCGCVRNAGVVRKMDSPKPDLSQRFLCDRAYVIETMVDRQTGVTYLVVRNGDNIGITPLLNRNGYPVISEEVGE